MDCIHDGVYEYTMECTHSEVYTQWRAHTVECTHRRHIHGGTNMRRDIHTVKYIHENDRVYTLPSVQSTVCMSPPYVRPLRVHVPLYILFLHVYTVCMSPLCVCFSMCMPPPCVTLHRMYSHRCTLYCVYTPPCVKALAPPKIAGMPAEWKDEAASLLECWDIGNTS